VGTRNPSQLESIAGGKRGNVLVACNFAQAYDRTPDPGYASGRTKSWLVLRLGQPPYTDAVKEYISGVLLAEQSGLTQTTACRGDA
jgi:hypothetical protein